MSKDFMYLHYHLFFEFSAVPVIESGLHQLKGKLQVYHPVKAVYIFVSIERKE